MEEDLDGKMGCDVASRMAHSITQEKDYVVPNICLLLTCLISFTRVYNQY